MLHFAKFETDCYSTQVQLANKLIFIITHSIQLMFLKPAAVVVDKHLLN